MRKYGASSFVIADMRAPILADMQCPEAEGDAAQRNKFYDGASLQVLRPADQGRIGVTIKGTPYKSRKREGIDPQAGESEPLPVAQGQLGESLGA